MRSSLAAACRCNPLRKDAAYPGILSMSVSCDRGSSNSTSESSMASMKYCDGAPLVRLAASAAHQVSGANWTMCSLPWASMTYFRRQPLTTNAECFATSPARCKSACAWSVAGRTLASPPLTSAAAPGEQRSTAAQKQDASNYLEGENIVAPTDTYARQTRSTVFNDTVYYK